MLMGKTLINGADREANWSGVVNFKLYANESSVECVVYFQQ